MERHRHHQEVASCREAGRSAADGLVSLKPPPRHVGRKFNPNGSVRGFAGNTIICHLPQQGDQATAFNALLDIYREAPAHGFLRKVSLLPPSSYHVTIFGGANDVERGPELWPRDLPADLPIGACNAVMADRLRGFRHGLDLPLRFRIDLAQPAPGELPLTMNLLPADERTDAALRRLRDRLSATMGIKAADHATYRFHVTVGYAIQWLTSEEQDDFARAAERWRAQIFAAAPVFELGAPEFCTMKDMFAFERQFFLESA